MTLHKALQIFFISLLLFSIVFFVIGTQNEWSHQTLLYFVSSAGISILSLIYLRWLKIESFKDIKKAIMYIGIVFGVNYVFQLVSSLL